MNIAVNLESWQIKQSIMTAFDLAFIKNKIDFEIIIEKQINAKSYLTTLNAKIENKIFLILETTYFN
ncbi:MAG: hypothetical protein GY830_02125 [Bacteroidetes bacterium]|nr:hypothetical protein [Bacteroidota bacterium]